MLKILNDLKPFFEDNYRRINVREYARLREISPPTASKFLSGLEKEKLLRREKERRFILYVANRENRTFIILSRLYWYSKIEKSGLLEYLQKEFINPTVILFGSFSEAEVVPQSDIDLVLFSVSKKGVDLRLFEKKLNRKIHLLVFKDIKDISNKNLLRNILKGMFFMWG